MGDNDSLTYTANKDGTIAIRDSEGKEVRYAKETDLLAVKGSTEVAEKRAKELSQAAEDSQKTHTAEIATANTNLETTRQQVLQAEAKVSSLEEKVKEGTGSIEELVKVKQELEAAKKGGEELSNKALEYRRQVIISTYGIPADTIKEKTMEQLDYYEEALKAVIATKGIGNYAIGEEAVAGLRPLTHWREQSKLLLKQWIREVTKYKIKRR